MARVISTITAALVCFALGAASRSEAAGQPGPLQLQGVLHGAPYVINVPGAWNGTLLLFAHGYRDKADHPGELDDRSASASPSPALEPVLLSLGYALAGTAYRDNGWAVNEGLQDVVNLTSFFRDQVANPDRTILWGFSMGSVIALKTLEQHGGLFDGAIAACAVGAGATRTFDLAADIGLAYDVTFGFPAPWGEPGHVRTDLDFDTEVLPVLASQLGDPTNSGRFEFLRLVNRIPLAGFYPGPGSPNWLLTDMFFVTEALAELQRRAGGPVLQNLDHHYRLDPAEIAYLGSLGVDAEGLLALMNARTTIEADTSARNYLEHNANYKGTIKHPVLTMHTTVDGFVPTSGEGVYGELVAEAGRSDQLVQVYTSSVSHCGFTGAQLLAAVQAVDSWIATGMPPPPGAFPASLGFVPGFVLPPFPQP